MHVGLRPGAGDLRHLPLEKCCQRLHFFFVWRFVPSVLLEAAGNGDAGGTV